MERAVRFKEGSRNGRAFSAGEGAYERIRADIVAGRLTPGSRLRLDQLRSDYAVGVSTLREMLSRLSSEGLVVAEGQRGFQVTPISVEELRDIAALRLLLEQHAMEASFRAGDLDWEGRVLAAHHKLASVEKTLTPGDTHPDVGKRYDFEFHHALVSACGSKVLLDTFANIYDRFLRYLVVALVFRGDVAREEHERLLRSALDRDVSAAQSTLAQHIQGAVDSALASGSLARRADPTGVARK